MKGIFIRSFIAGDINKLKAATGWTQKIPMEQTVSDMLDYWRAKQRGKSQNQRPDQRGELLEAR